MAKNSIDGLPSASLPHRSPFDIVVIGASLGGLSALEVLLKGLPQDFPAAIVAVLHRYRHAHTSLSNVLQPAIALPLQEVDDKVTVQPGQVYLAPADYHLLVEKGHLALSTDAPVTYARPSIDVLFQSAADAYGSRTVGVILTGASQDGADGLARIKARGGRAIAQDPNTAECRVMPEAAIARTTVDWILPLTAVAPRLVNLCYPALR